MKTGFEVLSDVCALGILGVLKDAVWPVFFVCAGWLGIGVAFGRWWRAWEAQGHDDLAADDALDGVDTEEETPPHVHGDGRHL